MAESNRTVTHSDNEQLPLSNRIESIIKHIQNNPGDSLVSRKTSNEAERHSDISLDESFKRETHKTSKNAEPIETTNEFISTSRTHLSRNIINHWVNTGYLLQIHMNTDKYSGINSLNQELSSCIYCDIPNAKSVCRSNSKEHCNNSSNGSSVDTAAYILSNANIKKKTDNMSNITDTICSKKITLQNTFHKDTCNERHEMSIGHKMLNNIVVDSNVATSTSALDNSYTNNKHANNQELKNNNVIEEELQLAESHTGFTNEICVNGELDDDISFNNSRETTQNLTEELANIDKLQSFPSQSSLNNSKCIRQKKLYTSRDSPIDIIIAEFKENNTDEMKKELHPAFRDSPPIIKTHKRKRTKFCLNNSQDKSNDISEDNDVSKEMQVAKRQRIFPVIENNIKKSRTSGKERLSESCKALKEQIKRFSIMDYIKVSRRKPNTKLNRRTKFEKRKRSENNIKIKTPKAKKNDQITDGQKNTYESNHATCSNVSQNTIVNFMPIEKVDRIADSDISTIIICNSKNLLPPDNSGSDCSTVIIDQSLYVSESDKTNKNQSNNSNDIKLKRLRPVVVLERLQKQVNTETSGGRKQSKKVVKRKNRSKRKRGRPKKSSTLDERKKKVDNSSSTFSKKILQSVVIKAPINLEKVQKLDQMDDTLNNNSMYATSSTKKQLNKSTNSDNKLTKKPIVRLERLPHFMITRYKNRLSGMLDSFNKILNDINTSDEENSPNEVSVKRNRRNLNKKNNISTNTSRTVSMKKTKPIINEPKRINEDNLPCFCTWEDLSDSEDDWDLRTPLKQFIFDIQAKKDQKQFKKKPTITAKRIEEHMLNDNINEIISMPSTSNILHYLSTSMTSTYNRSTKSTSNSSEVIKICSNGKQYRFSKNTTSSKYNNPELNIGINESDDNKDNIKKCIFQTKIYDSDSD